MLSISEIENKYGLNSLNLDVPYQNQDSLLFLDKCFIQLSDILNIDCKKIGCKVLNLQVSSSIEQMGFFIDEKINICFSNIEQLSKLSHEWFHFADFYINNLGYKSDQHLLIPPEFESEKNNNIFREILHQFQQQTTQQTDKKFIVTKYLPNIEEKVLQNVIHGDYSDIKDFKGLNYLKADLQSVGKSFVESSQIFDYYLTNDTQYYQKNTEMLARSFEAFLAQKLGKDNIIAKSNFFSQLYPQEILQQNVENLWNNALHQMNTSLIIVPDVKSTMLQLRKSSSQNQSNKLTLK